MPEIEDKIQQYRRGLIDHTGKDITEEELREFVSECLYTEIFRGDRGVGLDESTLQNFTTVLSPTLQASVEDLCGRYDMSPDQLIKAALRGLIWFESTYHTISIKGVAREKAHGDRSSTLSITKRNRSKRSTGEELNE